jgi:hypothetical protein
MSFPGARRDANNEFFWQTLDFAIYSDARWPDCDPMLADIIGDGRASNVDITPFVHLLTE